MEDKVYTEKDWKLFRSRIGTWQENYMNKLNNEYIELLSQDKNPSEKFWELEKRIKNDKRRPGVIITMSRSALLTNILDLLQDEVISMDDLDGFSENFKEVIEMYKERWDF